MKNETYLYVFFHAILLVLIVLGTHGVKWAGHAAQVVIFWGVFWSVYCFFVFARKKNCVDFCRKVVIYKEQKREQIVYLRLCMALEAVVLLCDGWIFTASAAITPVLVSLFISRAAKKTASEKQ